MLQRLEALEIRVKELEAERDALQARVLKLEHENRQLRNENAQLKAALSQSSRNSHRPPSSDASWKKRKKKPTGKKAGGQVGHKGHHRQVQAASIDEEKRHWPGRCLGCGGALAMQAESEHTHLQWELPEMRAQVIAHRYPKVRCCCCGRINRAEQAATERSAFGPKRSAFGPKLQATCGWLQEPFCLSRRDTQRMLSEVLGIKVSTGTLSHQRKAVGCALQAPVMQAEHALQTAPVSGMDETRYGMASGRGWLWVRASRLLTVFRLGRRRNREAAKRLLDKPPDGAVVVTDRYGVYRHLEPEQHQLCWAHLHRELIALNEHDKPAIGWLGARLCEDTAEVFALVKQMRSQTDAQKRGALVSGLSIARWGTSAYGVSLAPWQASV